MIFFIENILAHIGPKKVAEFRVSDTVRITSARMLRVVLPYDQFMVINSLYLIIN